jgi:phosphopantothenoylcysteine synthetase/decarboxylase
MTPASRFVTPLTLSTLSKILFILRFIMKRDMRNEDGTITLNSVLGDLVVIAPATSKYYV